jgi:hypothetical protein
MDEDETPDETSPSKLMLSNSKVVYPEPPQDFDITKHAEEIERYDPALVAEQMYDRKERKIPGSVLKPHSKYVNIVT